MNEPEIRVELIGPAGYLVSTSGPRPRPLTTCGSTATPSWRRSRPRHATSPAPKGWAKPRRLGWIASDRYGQRPLAAGQREFGLLRREAAHAANL